MKNFWVSHVIGSESCKIFCSFPTNHFLFIVVTNQWNQVPHLVVEYVILHTMARSDQRMRMGVSTRSKRLVSNNVASAIVIVGFKVGAMRMEEVGR